MYTWYAEYRSPTACVSVIELFSTMYGRVLCFGWVLWCGSGTLQRLCGGRVAAKAAANLLVVFECLLAVDAFVDVTVGRLCVHVGV